MEDRPSISLALASGEVRQILLKAGSRLLVVSGQLAWRDSPRWLAEQMVANTRLLGPEDVQLAEQSGWVELSARSTVQAVIIGPASVAGWSRLRCWLERRLAQGAPAEG